MNIENESTAGYAQFLFFWDHANRECGRRISILNIYMQV